MKSPFLPSFTLNNLNPDKPDNLILSQMWL